MNVAKFLDQHVRIFNKKKLLPQQGRGQAIQVIATAKRHVLNFYYCPERAWSGQVFQFFYDEVFKFVILGFGRGVRSNECPC